MPEKKNRRLAAIMFTDIVGYSAMMHANEKEGRAKSTRFRQVLQEYVDLHQGEVIQHYGDGSLSIFPSAIEAVDCARKIQIALKEAPQVPLRAGIHIGDIVVDGHEIFGDGVNIASRVESMGVPGSVLVTERIYYDLKSHPEFKMASLGFFRFKNIAKPMEVFALSNEGFPVPKAKNLKGKGRSVSTILQGKSLVIALFLLLAVIFLGIFGGSFFTKQEAGAGPVRSIQDDRIAIPVFQNFTFIDTLDVLGKMAAHWISKGLSETSIGSIVDYESVAERPEVLKAGMNNKKEQLSLLTGAVNIIEGTYSLTGQDQDSLVFSALIKDLKTGEILHSFPDQFTSRKAPLKAINQLSGHIMGYWVSKETQITSIPNYEAYKAFMGAKEVWNRDAVKAEKQLKLAIRSDATFYDPYFMLLSLFRDQGRAADIEAVIDKLRGEIQELNTRQKNYLFLSEAILRGDNKAAYKYALNEYAIHPKDFFVNTATMVYALEYVNAPERVISFFEEIPLDQLDLTNCSYCLERIYVAVLAYMKLNEYRKAGNLAQKIPLDSRYRGYSVAKARIQAHFNDTTAINQIIQSAAAAGQDRDYRFINYLVAEQFKLEGNETMMAEYARKVTDPDYPKNWRARSYILLDQLDPALTLYRELLQENPDHIRNRGDLGVVYAKMGNTGEARNAIQYLELNKGLDDRGAASYEQAKIYTQLGDHNLAIGKLRDAVREGIQFFYYRFENDPHLLPLLDNSEYQQLIHPLNESLN